MSAEAAEFLPYPSEAGCFKLLIQFARDEGPDFRTQVEDTSSRLEDLDECTFSASKGASGDITVTATSGRDSTSIVVKSSDAITLSGDKLGTQIYRIPGVGIVKLLVADDAFERASVTSSATHKTTECEVDF